MEKLKTARVVNVVESKVMTGFSEAVIAVSTEKTLVGVPSNK